MEEAKKKNKTTERISHFSCKTILSIFYRNNYDNKLEHLYLGQVLTIVFFQKFLRLNSHVPFPVNHTNHINKIGKLEIHKSATASFAISGGLYVQRINGLYIGEGTMIAPGTKIITANHSFDNLNDFVCNGPIRIGKNCWIGVNCSILPGVSLGDNCVVGSGAVVTKSFPDNSIIAGVPAKIIQRNSTLKEQE